MRIIITGSWTFRNYDLFVRKIERITLKLRDVTVLSAHQKGAELIGEWWAYRYWYGREIHYPNFKRFGSDAAEARNEFMVRGADALVVFKTKTNPHIKDLIWRAKRHKVKIIIVETGEEGKIPTYSSRLPKRPKGST